MFSFQITNSIIYDIDNGSKMKLYTENNSRQLVELKKETVYWVKQNIGRL